MRCGSREIAVEHRSDVLDFKGLTLEVDGLAETRCKSCGHTWTTDGQEQDNLNLLREAFAKKRDAVRDKEGLLTGEQIGHVLDQLQLTKAQAAELFGGGPNAFAKYMNGEVLQSFAMDRLLRLALAFGPRAVATRRYG
jgi:HTH-type transcriptional regulator/antitoxin MqsA